MNKPLSRLIDEFEQQITDVELRTNSKVRLKLAKLKNLASKFEQSRERTLKSKGINVEKR